MASLIPALAVGIVLGGVGFALAYFVLPSRLQPATESAAAVASTGGTNAAANPAAPADASSPSATPEKTERTTAETAATGNKVVTKFTIEEVTVNIADTRGNRFVRAGAYFDADPAVLEELEANRARMIDTFEQVLSTKTLEELTSPDVRGSLRTELLGIINPTLKEGRVDNIYFTDLLVQ
ncbi:MAG TPA: flagellar basal body-associated FliL family protein [Candidatus Methylacidiphilales bacterium]|nr:flagellar basal body-associated FliL family protein [Candidatus Methylacidiphilales bacterium]